MYNEKFINRNISELAQTYDSIHGANVNISRMIADYIDGLKPVQRRALYVMYLKDGGSKFRKLATISGETFGKAHPHSPVSIEGAIINLAQEWHNIIPLIEGSGNFGSCFSNDTEILTKNGWKLFSDLNREDLIASVNPTDGTLIYEKSVSFTNYRYTGEMINYLDNKMDFMVTPDHQMLVYDNIGLSNHKFINAEDLSINTFRCNFYQKENTHIDYISINDYMDENIPSYVFMCHYEDILSFIEKFVKVNFKQEFVKENGMLRFKYYKSAENMQRLMLHCGITSNIVTYTYNKYDKIITEYHLFYVSDFKYPIRKDNITRIKYDDMVYCVEVPTYHTIITRRNGKILLAGNCAGDPAGASRYIQARLSEYCKACFFEDWKDSVVDMSLAYDEETYMPNYLPAKYPNILLNGVLGIGYAASTSIPCYNFREVIESTIALMNNPNMNIVLIPDSPTGADIVETDFVKLCSTGKGSYMQRCTYDIDPENNMITITSLPDNITANMIRERIADIKEKNSLAELVSMNDMSGVKINIQLILRDDVNPYKFIKKLIKEIGGLEKVYPVNITVVNDLRVVDYSIKDLLLEWIKYRREQVRVVYSNKRTRLFSEQRINDIKIFILNKDNLDETIKIFRTSRNLEDIQNNLLKKYKDSIIRMDSVQAKTLSNMRFHELSIESYEKCLQRREDLINELTEVDDILNNPKGIDKVIISQLRDGIKRFGSDRRSNVVPYKISSSSDHDGYCVFQLSGDGMITRRVATNADEEPIPLDSNGFAVLIDNESSFILIDDLGYHSFIKAKDVPIDIEVPVSRYTKKPLNGKIIAMLPAESNKTCTLVSNKGVIKRINISELIPSKKPCITIEKGDKLVKGIVLSPQANKDLLIYTKQGYGQRLENNSIKVTSLSARGNIGFKLDEDDDIIGIFAISPEENDYILYTTIKGKQRINNLEFLPIRESRQDKMVSLINLPSGDRLFSVLGCNKLDKVTLYFADGDSEEVDLSKMKESTMSESPIKYVNKDMSKSSSYVVKVKMK